MYQHLSLSRAIVLGNIGGVICLNGDIHMYKYIHTCKYGGKHVLPKNFGECTNRVEVGAICSMEKYNCNSVIRTSADKRFSSPTSTNEMLSKSGVIVEWILKVFIIFVEITCFYFYFFFKQLFLKLSVQWVRKLGRKKKK